MSSPASKSVQSPLNLIVPIKSCVGLQELDAVLHLKLREMIETSDNIGSLHFARFFNFHDNNQMGFSRTCNGKYHD